MALPKKVKEQAKRAQELHDAAYKAKSDEGTEKPDQPPEEGDAPGSKEGAPPLEIVQTPEQGDSPVETDPPAEEEPETPPAAAATDDGWEHKYKVIEGKYRAEVPRLHNEIKELRTQVTNMTALLARLEEAPKTAPAVEDAPKTAKRLIDDKEVETYGADLVDVMKRAAREEMAPEVSRLEKENEELRNQLSGMGSAMVENARQEVFNTLDKEIGAMNVDWRALNSDAGYLEWLGTVDPYTNTVRRDLLDAAFEANDAARVVAFFKGYLKENAVVTPAAVETPAPGKTKPKVDMASLAAPGKPKGTATPGTQEGQQTWRQSEIAAFYADVRRGAFKGNPDEKLRLEQSIMDAVKNNRVIAS